MDSVCFTNYLHELKNNLENKPEAKYYDKAV